MNQLAVIQDELRSLYPTLCGVKPQEVEKPQAPRVDPTAIILGKDGEDWPVGIGLLQRLEHMLIVGATRSGKTRLLLHYLRQALRYGESFAFLDPHGSHPDSAFKALLPLIETLGVKAHIIDFSAPYKIGFNPLHCPPDTDPSVIAGHNLDAISVSREDESLAQKPSIERCLTMVFSALADMGLTYVEALMLIDREDSHGLRAYAIQHVKDPYTRDELKWFHDLSLDGRRKREWDQETVGPRNRLQRLLSPPALRVMLGQRRQFLDIQAAMDNGEPIVMNLSGGANVYEKSADLFGRLFVRSVLFYASRRTNTDPYTLMLDEAPRFLSGDIPILLGEVRKRGVSVVAAMQWLEQANTPDGKILAALLNGTNGKILFRLRDAEEAEKLAHSNIPVNLETPVEILNKNTVVGHIRTKLANGSEGEQHSETDSTTNTKGKTKNRAVSAGKTLTEGTAHVEGESDVEMHSKMRVASDANTAGSNHGASAGVVMVPNGEYWNPVSTSAETEGENSGDSLAHTAGSAEADGLSHGKGRNSATIESSSLARSLVKTEGEGEIDALSKGKAKTSGTNKSAGFNEALEPVYRHLPTAVHSKDSMLYKAGQMLCSLPTGVAYVNFVGRHGRVSTLFTVPPIFTTPMDQEEFAKLRDHLIAQSPAALPIEEAQENIERRAEAIRQRKIVQPSKPRKTTPVIDTPEEKGTWG